MQPKLQACFISTTSVLMSGVYIPHQVLALDQLFCPSAPLLVACSASVVVPLDHHHHHQDQHELEPPQHLTTIKHTYPFL